MLRDVLERTHPPHEATLTMKKELNSFPFLRMPMLRCSATKELRYYTHLHWSIGVFR